MYPELDSLSLTELEARFRAAAPEDPNLEHAAPPEDPELEYDDLWYAEVASRSASGTLTRAPASCGARLPVPIRSA